MKLSAVSHQRSAKPLILDVFAESRKLMADCSHPETSNFWMRYQLSAIKEKSKTKGSRKNNTHFRIPSSGHLRPIVNHKILEIVPLFLWFYDFRSNKSNLNPGANSVKLILREPLAER